MLPHWLQHVRLPCPLLSPRVCSNSYPLSQWCSLTISSCDTLFSFCLPSFPALRSFPMSFLFTSNGQSIGTSALASVLPVKIQGWLPLGLTGVICLLSNGLSKVHNLKATVFQHSAFYMVQLSDLYLTTGKTIDLTNWTFVSKVMS